jgi:fatty acid desaturase
MSSSGSNSGGGFAGLLGLAVIGWIIVKLIWWIVGAAVLVGVFFLVRTIVRESNRRAELDAAYRRAVAARADQQHNWVLRGDDRGIYGPEGAELMHYLYPALKAPWRAGRRRGG